MAILLQNTKAIYFVNNAGNTVETIISNLPAFFGTEKKDKQ
jgi:hypothetical protein